MARKKAEPAVKAMEATEEGKAEAPQKSARASSSKAAAKESGQKTVLHVQYAGKSVAEEDLIKSAKDIWEYDLKHKAGDLTSIELYVKPEENMVYYVMNEDVKGSFPI